MTNSGNIASAYTLLVNSIKYDVTIDKHRKISSIFIRDEKFSTSDKIRLGASYESIKKNLLQGKAIVEPGSASYFESQSGWGIAFDFRKAIEKTLQELFLYLKGLLEY